LGKMRFVYPTVIEAWHHPPPELRKRWKKQYGKERFSFEEALYAQSFPSNWLFPPQESKRWKWIAEAFPPAVAEYLLRAYLCNNDNVLLDLFAGIGGWSLGAVWSKKVKKIVMVEIDKEKCNYLRLNFSRLNIDFEVICEDVRKVDYSKIGRIDVITSSPPCEDLSKLRFLNKYDIRIVRGTIPLTMFTIELVDKLKPRVALYENVYRKELRQILERAGWICQRFDMSFIIPQKRIRLICAKIRSMNLLDYAREPFPDL